MADLGWKPKHYLANVSASVASTLKPAGLENSKDIITAAYLKDPTDPQWENAPDFIEWKAWMAAMLLRVRSFFVTDRAVYLSMKETWPTANPTRTARRR